MKRPKRKVFKQHIDLIRHAVRSAIQRHDVDVPTRMAIAIEDYQMKNPPDFLEQAKRRLNENK